MRKIVPFVVLAGGLGFSACESFGQAMTAHTDVVARAAGHELSVEQAAALIAQNPRIPAESQVVDAVANLWVDYMLMATAAAEDSTLSNVDLDPLIRPHVEQEIVWKLRDGVIAADTTFDDDELRALYEREQPDLQVRARHVLLRVPADATPTQRDSVLALAREIRDQARAGTDFAQLARRHSQEPGAAERGGDLGFFGRGQMVAPFEEAAFALDVGEVSDVVETPFGYHVIRVEERRLPPFEEARAAFEQQAKVQRQVEAEEAYVTGLTGPLGIEIDEGAYDVARELAGKPTMNLSRRAESRPLVKYEGGAFTAGEYMDLVRRATARERGAISAASDDQLEGMLRGLTHNEVLINEARRQGLDVTGTELDSISEVARKQLENAAGLAGLRNIPAAEGETPNQAIERKVRTLIEEIVRGERQVLPLGPIAFSLRDKYDAEIFERAYPAVIARVETLRPAAGAEQQPQPGAPQQTPQQPQDTGRN